MSEMTPEENTLVETTARLREAREAVKAVLKARDEAVLDLYRAGAKPSRISELGQMSGSNVRAITDRLKWAGGRAL